MTYDTMDFANGIISSTFDPADFKPEEKKFLSSIRETFYFNKINGMAKKCQFVWTFQIHIHDHMKSNPEAQKVAKEKQARVSKMLAGAIKNIHKEVTEQMTITIPGSVFPKRIYKEKMHPKVIPS